MNAHERRADLNGWLDLLTRWMRLRVVAEHYDGCVVPQMIVIGERG